MPRDTSGVDYQDKFQAVADVVLAESWVLEVAPFDTGAAFRLDVVITERHPDYSAARPGEVYSYRKGWLRLFSDSGAELALSGARPARDASGEEDLGHIDSFDAVGGDWWELQGDWGLLRVRQPTVELVLD